MTIAGGIIRLGLSTNTSAEKIQTTTMGALASDFKMAVNKDTTVMDASSTMAAASAIELERPLPQTRLSSALGKVKMNLMLACV